MSRFDDFIRSLEALRENIEAGEIASAAIAFVRHDDHDEFGWIHWVVDDDADKSDLVSAVDRLSAFIYEDLGAVSYRDTAKADA